MTENQRQPADAVTRWRLGSLSWGLLALAMMAGLALFGLGAPWYVWGALLVGFGNSFIAAWRHRKRPGGTAIPFALHLLALAIYSGLAFTNVDVRVDFWRTRAAREAVVADFASDPAAIRNNPSVGTTDAQGDLIWRSGPVNAGCVGERCAVWLERSSDLGLRRGYVYAPDDALPASIGDCALTQSSHLEARWFWAYCNPE